MKTSALFFTAIFATSFYVSAETATPIGGTPATPGATGEKTSTDKNVTGATANSTTTNNATAATSAAPTAAAATGTVARATLTTGVVNREPIDRISTIASDKSRVYYFTELQGMAGQSITHRWEHNGKVVSEVKLDVGGPHWRAYSSKTLDPSLIGDWKVSVIDANGSTVSANTFTYTTAAATTDNTGTTQPAALKTPAADAAPAAPQSTKN